MAGATMNDKPPATSRGLVLRIDMALLLPGPDATTMRRDLLRYSWRAPPAGRPKECQP
jgi:hypothetical protein